MILDLLKPVWDLQSFLGWLWWSLISLTKLHWILGLKLFFIDLTYISRDISQAFSISISLSLVCRWGCSFESSSYSHQSDVGCKKPIFLCSKAIFIWNNWRLHFLRMTDVMDAGRFKVVSSISGFKPSNILNSNISSTTSSLCQYDLLAEHGKVGSTAVPFTSACHQSGDSTVDSWVMIKKAALTFTLWNVKCLYL